MKALRILRAQRIGVRMGVYYSHPAHRGGATAWTRTTTTMLKGMAKAYGIQTKLPKKRMEEVCPMHDSQSGSPSNLNAL
jgi:hypothetical protein